MRSILIATRCIRCVLEERVVEAIESASTSVALEGALHGFTQPERTVIVLRHETSPRSSA